MKTATLVHNIDKFYNINFTCMWKTFFAPNLSSAQADAKCMQPLSSKTKTENVLVAHKKFLIIQLFPLWFDSLYMKHAVLNWIWIKNHGKRIEYYFRFE